MASGRPTTKNIYFLRAFYGNNPVDIESALKRAREKQPNVGDTEIESADGEVLRIQRGLPLDNPNFFHIVKYAPGELAPTIERHVEKPEGDEDAQQAPKGREFKDGECFIMVKKSNVLFLGHGVTSQRAESYLRELFNTCLFKKRFRKFEMEPVANIDKVKLMQDQGVKSIKLSSCLYNLEVPDIENNTIFSRFGGFIKDQMMAAIQKDDSFSELKAAEDLIVNLELKLDGNTRAGPDAKGFIDNLANTAVDDDNLLSGFIIETRTGVPISPTEVRLHQKTTFTIDNKSLSFVYVQSAMKDYMEKLSELNLLE